MKKLMALFVAVIMVTTLALPATGVLAQETLTPDYSDNATVDKGNIIKDPDNLGHLMNSNSHGTFAEAVEGSHITWQDTTVNAETDASFVAGPTRLAYKSNGTLMGHFVDGFGETTGWTEGETYVYSVRLKNAAPDKDESPLFGMAFGWYREAEDKDALVTFEVTNTDDYKTYTGYYTSKFDKNALSLGFAYPDSVIPYSAKGAQISMDISKGGSLLVAKEAPTEITNKVTGSSVLAVGNSSSVQAEVLNQIGEKGNISQDIEWIVLNEDRTEVTNGITLTDNGNGTATVTAESEGSYVVLAKCGELRKGVNISVVGAMDFSDNATVDKGNIIKDPDNLGHLMNSNSHGTFAEAVEGSHITWQDTTVNAETDASFVAGPTRLAYKSNGTLMGHFVDGFGETTGWTEGETYVYSVRLKNAAPDKDESPLFGMAFGWYREAEDKDALVTFEVTNTDDYKTYTGYYTSKFDKNALSLGFAYPDSVIPYSAKGAQISMDISKGGSLLVAKEAPTEITNEITGSAVLTVGSTTTARSEVLNQIGEKGNISQNISWFAVNEERNMITDGVIVSDNGDGTATIRAEREGDYVIVAQQGELCKGVEISVTGTDKFSDNAKLDDGNIIKDPDNLEHLSNTNSNAADIVEKVEGSHITWQDKDVASQGDIPFMAGPTYLAYKSNGVLKGHFIDGFGETTGWTVGETYVYSVRLKNSAPDKDASPSFGMSFDTSWANRNSGTLITYEIENTEYETYSGYYTSPVDKSVLSLGFTCLSRPYTAKGGRITMDISNGGSLLVAKEAPTEITAEVTGDSILYRGSTTTVESRVLNQIGEKGNVSQDVKWVALNADRTKMAEGVTVVPGSDGTAQVKISDYAEAGDYVILAMSDVSELRKGVSITVKGPSVTAADVEFSDGKAVFNNAKAENIKNGDKIMFVIASYNTENNKLIEAKCSVVSAEDNAAELSESIAVSASEGDCVRAFVWYAETLSPIKFEVGTENKWNV